MVAPVPAHISKFPPHSPQCAAASLLTTHHPLPTLFLPPLCFHTLTNCFSRNPFIFTLICVAPGCHLSASLHPQVTSHKSRPFILLEPLCRLFAPFSALASFVFSRLQPLFPKCRGAASADPLGGHPGRECLQHLRSELRLRRHMRHVAPLSPAPSLDCVYFPPPRGCTSPLSCFGLLVPTPPRT